jgi:hypothetical protein
MVGLKNIGTVGLLVLNKFGIKDQVWCKLLPILAQAQLESELAELTNIYSITISKK